MSDRLDALVLTMAGPAANCRIRKRIVYVLTTYLFTYDILHVHMFPSNNIFYTFPMK